jgi:TPR repeat protein
MEFRFCYEKAMKKNNPDSQNYLGLCYHHGMNYIFFKDIKKAIYW